jgi:small multidrug resistance pump
MHAWILLSIAILFEVAGTTAMKFSGGFSYFWPSVMLFAFYALAFIALTLALKKLDLSIAYAIWAGVGTLLITLIGFYFFSEDISSLKIIFLGLIIIGVIGLRLTT